jgi:hypothetical protein
VTQEEGKQEGVQEGEEDSEEEDDHQEESSREEGEGERQCSACGTGVSVFECVDCHTPLHESCASSLNPFLCDFCMRKKRLREQECETDATSERDESEEEGYNGGILAVYSASTSSSDDQSGEEYTLQEKHEVEPFTIGGQNGTVSGGRRLLRRKTEMNRGNTREQISPIQTKPNNHTLRSEVKKEVKK